MKKYNIEYDLFRILKSKRQDEIYYVILKMVNNTYKYEYRYLNRIPYEELMIYLEKFIVIGSRITKVDSLEELIEAILQFSKNLDKLSFKRIRNNKALNLKYNLKIMMSKIKANSLKVKVSSLLLAVVILVSLYSKDMKAIEHIDDLNDFGIETEEDYEIKDYNELINNAISYENEIAEEVVVELSNEEKIDIILEKFNLTEEEFNVVCAIAMTEAKPNSYDDAYCVINTIYNRTISNSWIEEINKLYPDDVGRSLYYQAIHPNQFVVYQEGNYERNLNVREGETFQAVIDFLYTLEIKHDYLSFRSYNTELDFTFEQFTSDGNKYFNRIREEDRIIIEEVNNSR